MGIWAGLASPLPLVISVLFDYFLPITVTKFNAVYPSAALLGGIGKVIFYLQIDRLTLISAGQPIRRV